MNNILNILEKETEGKCYASFRYCADEELKVPTISYDNTQSFTVVKDRFGETDTTLKTTKDLTGFATRLQNEIPLFRYFLDGSRRTYKVDDIEINRRVYPIMAGQLGVACCERRSPDHFKCVDIENSLLLSLPAISNPNTGNNEQFFNALTQKINNASRLRKTNFRFSKVLTYSSVLQDEAKKYENLGIATIQDEMIDCEKKIVARLYTQNLLSAESYLVKDGSLQYKQLKTPDQKELTRFKNHYRWVIGVSKMFNPELSKDKNGKSNADKIAKLSKFHRTPVFMYQSDMVRDVHFAIWYVRIREAKYSESPFSGVLKIEKILITDEEQESGLDSAEVDLITANIINERNPVCYGNDSRWANHLYPVYLTETFIKSKYLSDLHFLNLF